jgi:hypothetical protein
VNSWKVILATIIIFGAGVFTGGLLVEHVQRPFPVHPQNPSKPPEGPDMLPQPLRPEILNKQFVEQLDDKLDLTLQQSNQIQKIIAQGQQNSRDLWKAVAPSFQGIWRETRQEIRDTLTPDQRKKFEMLMKQRPMHHPLQTNAPPDTNVPPPPVVPSTETNSPAV